MEHNNPPVGSSQGPHGGRGFSAMQTEDLQSEFMSYEVTISCPKSKNFLPHRSEDQQGLSSETMAIFSNRDFTSFGPVQEGWVQSLLGAGLWPIPGDHSRPADYDLSMECHHHQ